MLSLSLATLLRPSSRRRLVLLEAGAVRPVMSFARPISSHGSWIRIAFRPRRPYSSRPVARESLCLYKRPPRHQTAAHVARQRRRRRRLRRWATAAATATASASLVAVGLSLHSSVYPYPASESKVMDPPRGSRAFGCRSSYASDSYIDYCHLVVTGYAQQEHGGVHPRAAMMKDGRLS